MRRLTRSRDPLGPRPVDKPRTAPVWRFGHRSERVPTPGPMPVGSPDAAPRSSAQSRAPSSAQMTGRLLPASAVRPAATCGSLRRIALGAPGRPPAGANPPEPAVRTLYALPRRRAARAVARAYGSPCRGRSPPTTGPAPSRQRPRHPAGPMRTRLERPDAAQVAHAAPRPAIAAGCSVPYRCRRGASRAATRPQRPRAKPSRMRNRREQRLRRGSKQTVDESWAQTEARGNPIAGPGAGKRLPSPESSTTTRSPVETQ